MSELDVKKEAINFIKSELDKQLSGADYKENDNLIQFGLSSIMVMQISSRLRKYGLRIPFVKMFEKPTFESWKALIEKAKVREATKKKDTKLSKDPFNLTDVQYAYFAGRDEERVLGKVSCHAYMEYDCGDINPKKLSLAWNIVQNHHPMLRAKFSEDGMQQFMDEPYSKEISVIDCSNKSDDEIEGEIENLRAARTHRKLRIELGEVASLALVLLPENKTKLIFDVDLLVADVASIGIILDDLAIAYETGSLTTKGGYSFRDYLKAQLNKEAIKRINDTQFWESKIDSIPEACPNLHLKVEPEKLDTQRFERLRRDIRADEWKAVKNIAAECGVTPSMVLLAAYGLVLERWSNQESFFINLPLFDRKIEDENVERMVADFTNLLLVDFHRKKNEAFLDTVKRVKATFMENISHDSCSGVEVQRLVQKKNGNMKIVAPVVFACNIDASIETDNSRRVFGDMSYMISQTPQVWLDFQVYEKDDVLSICWDHVQGLFEESMLDDMQQALVKLLKSLTEKKGWEAIPKLLPEYQFEAFCEEVDLVKKHSLPDKNLLTGIMEAYKSNPDKVAIEIYESNQSITYGQLVNQASRVANYLKASGVKPLDYVGVRLPRGLEQILCCIGILMVGGCYVPVGLNQPEARINQIKNQIDISCIIDDLSYEKCQSEFAQYNCDRNDSAYIIMTSGSTGVPKCVEVSHISAVNTIDEVVSLGSINENAVALMVAALDFDLSVFDIFGVLGAGGKLVLLNDATAKDPGVWMDCIEKYYVNTWNSTPMAFDMCVTYAQSQGKKLPLDTVMLSGDWIALELPKRFYDMNPLGKVIAMGGATEGAIWSNYQIVPKEIPASWKSIPYGRPLKGQTYKVVDDLGRICPYFVAGELCIGGNGVAKGYKGDEALTKEKFEFSEIAWYKTGDQGMIWDDKTIEFLGRKDNQVKIKGYRIELGEVESAINKLSYIKNAIVCAVEHGGKKQLAAFVCFENGEVNQEELRGNIAKYLPDYMVPDIYRFEADIPLTENGKADRKAINAILSKEKTNEAIVAPEGEIEEAIFRVWSEVLEKKEISRDDNYFSLGGDSLKALTIVTKLQKEIHSPMKWSTNLIYKAPTIRALGQIVEENLSEMEEDVI